MGDIDNILKQAVVSKSIEQVNWLTEFELGPIFPLFRKWIHWEFLMVYPNRKRRLFSKVLFLLLLLLLLFTSSQTGTN